MGLKNGKLIQACEKARREGDSQELERLTILVEESQRNCSHDREPKRNQVTKPPPSGKYQVGDIVTWCLDCGGAISVYRPKT